jgi:uncharacterized membrane protein YheB (UPF0754 family)
LFALESVLKSSDDQAPSFISLFFEICQNLHDESFWSDRVGQNLIHLFNESKNVENLLSLLVFDWWQPSNENPKKYCLTTKSQKYLDDTGKNLAEKLFEIVDGSKIYRAIS